MKKKLLALVLAAVMILGFMPKNVKADETYPNPVTVYLSISDDDAYVLDCNDDPVAFREITVPYFNLADYGLSYYYFSSESYGNGDPENQWSHYSNLQPGTSTTANGKVTLLHLFIYTMERYYFGYPESECGTGQHAGFIKTMDMPSNNLSGTGEMTITGTPGSIYFTHLWGFSYPADNLNYFRNYKYPLASAGWGATADQIILRDGDVITLGHFSEYGQLFDPNGIFAYARPYGESYNNTPADDLTAFIENVEVGDSVDLTFYHARVSSSFSPIEDELSDDVPVFACKISDLTDCGGAIADQDGNAILPWEYIDDTYGGDITIDTTDWTPGIYLVATPGWNSAYGSNIVCAPGGILIEVVN